MAFPNQIPRVDEIIVPGIVSLRTSRPNAASFLANKGRYGNIIAGWRAQARLAIAFLANEVVSCRLGSAAQPMATGGALTALCRSEFDTDREAGAVAAIGLMFLARGSGNGGAIPQGFRFRRDADPSAVPAVPAAQYEMTQDVPVNYWSSDLPQPITVPIIASQPGAAGNAPEFDDGPLGASKLKMVDTPFDPTIAITGPVYYQAAGGLDSESDADLIAQAQAYTTGQYGPTLGAILAGALRGTGAHRVVIRDIYTWDNNGLPAAVTGVCLADASWASGSAWVAQVQQKIADNFQGFGLALVCTGVTNIAIRVECAVTVRDAASLSYTADLTAAIQTAVRSYFDDRPDWYTFRNTPGVYGGLRAAIAAADRRLLTCTSATVLRLRDSAPITQPSAALPFANSTIGLVCTHWMLVANGVTVAFSAPS